MERAVVIVDGSNWYFGCAAVTATGRRVFVASPAAGARLAEVATGYLRLRRPWFADVYAP